MNLAILYYVYDPMCSWCWGYRPAWSALQTQLAQVYPELKVEYRLGGLAPDTDEPMANDMQELLKQTWSKISQQLGTEFNFDFWQQNEPRRSTYPACRATLIAREQGLEKEMLLAIQQAYYLEAKNPSDDRTLIELASNLGMSAELFAKALTSEVVEANLLEEINRTRHLPLQGFPSLVLLVNGELYLIDIDYTDASKSFEQISHLVSN